MYNKPIDLRQDKTLGYLYFMDRDHPLGDQKGRVWHHRHVASLKLGRWLEPEEIVHHKDDLKDNNDPRNLKVTTNAAHTKHHNLKRSGTEEREIKCGTCRKVFRTYRPTARFCSPKCSQKGRRVWTISRKQLERLVQEIPLTAIAKQFGVSDVAVAKRCKALEIEHPRQKRRK